MLSMCVRVCVCVCVCVSVVVVVVTLYESLHVGGEIYFHVFFCEGMFHI